MNVNYEYAPGQYVSFNADWAAKKSEAEFVKHESHHDLTDEQIKEAYKLCLAAVKPVLPAKPADKQTDKPIG
jgi:hypothetical protein